MADQLLSLVLPAYKQEKTISKDIDNLKKVLTSASLKYELIVVVDGFEDKTYQIAKRKESRNVKVIGYRENQGKGYAIKLGVKEAKGDIIGFIDAGLDLDPKEITLMLKIMEWNNADIVIGSKLHPESKVNYPLGRKILSWGYRNLTRILFELNVKDTQVGLKLFKRNVAKRVFRKILVKRFAFDVEVLAVARLYGYTKIYEAPIKLKFRPGTITAANFWKIVFWFLVDTLAVFYRINIVRYYD